MKKYLTLSAACIALAACSNESLVDKNIEQQGKEAPICLNISQRNMTRASLESTGHYNFGVWAYKNTDQSNAVMDNYLVGYMDESNKKGYFMKIADQTTLGDKEANKDGESYWAYEKMGSAQYQLTSNNEGENYYLSNQNKYMSNKQSQWLKYWDYSSANTEFFAYAPYVNGANTPTFAISGKQMTFKADAIEAGYDDLSLFEYMVAYTNQVKASYAKDVQLAFKRMNAKINIKFWENIDGYDVEILDLKGNTSNNVTGVQATPAVATTTNGTTTYATSDKFWTKASAVVNFSSGAPACTVTGTTNQTANLEFKIPTTRPIATEKSNATASPTTYYGIPLGTSNKTGFTFHISYKLTSLDTKETITVNNATVHVPATNVQWEANKHYTYIFKITKNSSGSTDGGKEENYTSPTPSNDKALYPIVFDGCTVVDWVVAESDHAVN